MYKIRNSKIPEVFCIEPKVSRDERVDFVELYKRSLFKELNLPHFVQDNVSSSVKGVLRGLHFQSEPFPQGKLVSSLKGKFFDVVVDIRPSTQTFCQSVNFILDGSRKNWIYIPPGFAHGFCTLSSEGIILYKNTEEFNSANYHGIRWNDPTLNIKWPVANPIISQKDSKLPLIKKLLSSDVELTDI